MLVLVLVVAPVAPVLVLVRGVAPALRMPAVPLFLPLLPAKVFHLSLAHFVIRLSVDTEAFASVVWARGPPRPPRQPAQPLVAVARVAAFLFVITAAAGVPCVPSLDRVPLARLSGVPSAAASPSASTVVAAVGYAATRARLPRAERSGVHRAPALRPGHRGVARFPASQKQQHPLIRLQPPSSPP